jgi:hypothetical protein
MGVDDTKGENNDIQICNLAADSQSINGMSFLLDHIDLMQEKTGIRRWVAE